MNPVSTQPVMHKTKSILRSEIPVIALPRREDKLKHFQIQNLIEVKIGSVANVRTFLNATNTSQKLKDGMVFSN